MAHADLIKTIEAAWDARDGITAGTKVVLPSSR